MLQVTFFFTNKYHWLEQWCTRPIGRSKFKQSKNVVAHRSLSFYTSCDIYTRPKQTVTVQRMGGWVSGQSYVMFSLTTNREATSVLTWRVCPVAGLTCVVGDWDHGSKTHPVFVIQRSSSSHLPKQNHFSKSMYIIQTFLLPLAGIGNYLQKVWRVDCLERRNIATTANTKDLFD